MPSLHVLDHAPPLSGHLPMGTPDDAEHPISVDGRAIRRAGRPWIPVMGEFHFSRYPAEEWRTELGRMRAGGIDVVATYLFWNHHEPTRGEFRFDASRDIGRFVRLCGELGLAAAVRIGPWSHGECRDGGFPDWLAAVECVPRTDDPAYLALVADYYARIGRELAGLSWNEGGPIVAVQVENELYDQPGHLATLRTMAEAAGIDAPLWTATGWGAPRLPPDVLLPLYGGYPEAFWADAADGWAREMRCHYFFTSIRDDHAIGADLRPAVPAGASADHVPPDDRRYPYATCELGGGMAIAYHRRPLIPAADISALALAKLGSGSVWQGYYLYHGCSQRQDLPTPNQESHETGYPNDLPVVNYDFQAPLGEYGQVRPSFHALRVQHLFLRDSGSDLADLPVQLPDAVPEGLDDREILRWSVRSDGRRGFLFVNNHQPHEPLPDHADVRFEVRQAAATVRLPVRPVTIPGGAHFVWPIGYSLAGGQRLDWASAQPLARLTVDGVPLSVFAAAEGIDAQFAFAAPVSIDGQAAVEKVDGRTVVTVSRPGTDARFSVIDESGRAAEVLVLGQADALRLQRSEIAGVDTLVLCDDPVVPDGDVLRVEGVDDVVTVAMLPAPASLVGAERIDDDGVFAAWQVTTAGAPPRPRLVRSADEAAVPPARTGGPHQRASAPTDADFENAATFHVTVDERAFDGDAEVLLRLTYTGDVARAYVGGRLVADHFWFGPDWDVGLRRIADDVLRHGIEIRVLPRPADARVYVDPAVRHRFAPAGARPEIQHARLSRTHRITLRPEWEGRDA
ncbi:Beta-galactosidase precursor [Actinoalloteichus hoggarensis]|uniref:Beta-galactosidase n=2 Tax=Actinoalloteichus hoggarensis TaxID=1470176 RepID=A0A221W6X1_9PSEU|nr:Beta-galactosidase precursor [Actinoalloteichus hoggarensis]